MTLSEQTMPVRTPRRGPKYQPPAQVDTCTLDEFLAGKRSVDRSQQARLAIAPDLNGSGAIHLWTAGDRSLVQRSCVAIVGTRNVSEAGAARARRLARELVAAGVVVASGLAKGVDTEAIGAAIGCGGHVIGVIGTPLDTAYPAENKRLQEKVYKDHLLVSQFAPGSRVYRSNFPVRNKLMAALSDATVIIEAGEGSGTIHQAAECHRLGRWLLIARSVVEDASLTWPAGFLGHPRTKILTATSDVLEVIEA